MKITARPRQGDLPHGGMTGRSHLRYATGRRASRRIEDRGGTAYHRPVILETVRSLHEWLRAKAAGWGIVLLYLGGLAVLVGGRVVRGLVVESARRLTGGEPAGMAAAAWLVAVAPFALAGLLLLLSGRVHRRWLIAGGAVLAMLVALLLNLSPYGRIRHDVVTAVSGPGGSGFLTGLKYGILAGALPLITVPPLLTSRRLRRSAGAHLRRRTAVAVGLFATGMLVAALLRA